MTLTLNKNNYLNLLDKTNIIPKIIESEAEYEEYLVVAENLIAKKNNRTIEETTLLRLVVKLIEDYEERAFSLKDGGNLLPHEILQHILDVSDTKQDDLAIIISASQFLISDIINGKLPINKQQAQMLGEYFKVPPNLFT